MRWIPTYGFLLVILALSWWYWNCLPQPLFEVGHSTVIESRDGELLGARISPDGQWRFPVMDSVPEDFAKALILFEDKRFWDHSGVDPLALCRALRQNVQERRVVSGASTLSMQVIRLSLGAEKRTIWRKLYEMILATRLEQEYSKQEILNLWASYAPMGGNIVGVEAASWRYFGTSPQNLSLAEFALLAVLPNAPSLMHPGRRRDALKTKRDRLLTKMEDQGLITEEDLQLALLEDLPQSPKSLPKLASHWTDRWCELEKGNRYQTTVQKSVQSKARAIVDRHHQTLQNREIHNVAAIILDTRTGEVLGYIGNAPRARQYEGVDMVQARRSSGSILKPFLYAGALDRAQITPWSLLADVPVSYGGYSPENFDRQHSGAIPADQALARSLNIPAVGMLADYGVSDFQFLLQELGLSTIDRSAEDYGLSLILGGAEVTLWEVAQAYAGIGRTLLEYVENSSQYRKLPLANSLADVGLPPNASKEKIQWSKERHTLSAGAIFHTMMSMTEVVRPASEGRWQQFASQAPLAWKTGTSYGHRDAWAVGVNARYTIAVWVGNADGEGRKDLTGVLTSAPILFDIVNSLSGHEFFEIPHDDMDSLSICAQSGMKAGAYCRDVDSRLTLSSCAHAHQCPYHQLAWLNESDERVYRHCASGEIRDTSLFILPTAWAHYYRKSHPEYASPPRWAVACNEEGEGFVSILYPRQGEELYLPQGAIQENKLILEATTRDPNSALHWHLNRRYLGSTREDHRLSVMPHEGENVLTVIDEKGHRSTCRFTTLDKGIAEVR